MKTKYSHYFCHQYFSVKFIGFMTFPLIKMSIPTHVLVASAEINRIYL